MVAQGLADLQDGLELVTTWPSYPSSLIDRPGNLIEVAADRAQFSYNLLQGGEFVLGQRSESSEVRAE